MIELPEVLTAQMTCGACPEQWEGTLVDGRGFYFRLRSGWASLSVWDDPEDSSYSTSHGMSVKSDGLWLSSSERDATFHYLLATA